MCPKSSATFANRLCAFAALLLAGLGSPALADNENDIWYVTVVLNVPGVPNPLEWDVFRSFGQAEAAMKGAHADAAFLRRIWQNAAASGWITTRYEIPPQNLAEWRPWQYYRMSGGSPYASEAEIIALEMQADVCGSGSMTPTSGWTWLEGNAIYERERRTFDKTTTHPTSIPTPPYTTCTPYTTQTSSYTMTRIRYLKCPVGAPWHEQPPRTSDGLCHNDTGATINDKQPHQVCIAEEDGADPFVGNPCNAATGNKLQIEPDYSGPELSFVRAYNSLTQIPANAGLGDKWTHNYASRLALYNGTGAPTAWVRQNGELELLLWQTSTYAVGERSAVQLVKTGSDWDLHLRGGATHRYSGTTGRLLWIKNAAGQQRAESCPKLGLGRSDREPSQAANDR